MNIRNASISKKTCAVFFAIFFALPLVAVVSSAHAQNPTKASRDSAMQNCIATAQKQFPDSDTQSSARVSVYKSCMARAGFRA